MHRTTISITVLSEEPIPDGMELSDVIRECYEGDYVLAVDEWKVETLTNPQMATALYDAGSDPDFFQIEEAAK